MFKYVGSEIKVETQCKYPGDAFVVEGSETVIHSIKVGKYIRPIGHTKCSPQSCQNYIENKGSVSDQKAVFEVAMRL